MTTETDMSQPHTPPSMDAFTAAAIEQAVAASERFDAAVAEKPLGLTVTGASQRNGASRRSLQEQEFSAWLFAAISTAYCYDRVDLAIALERDGHGRDELQNPIYRTDTLKEIVSELSK